MPFASASRNVFKRSGILCVVPLIAAAVTGSSHEHLISVHVLTSALPVRGHRTVWGSENVGSIEIEEAICFDAAVPI
jgi:hypothetical protein